MDPFHIAVLDHGYVRFVEDWGRGEANAPEAGIIEAARQSTQGSFRGWEQDEKLLGYLLNAKPPHATPFEFAGMVLEVQAPIFVFREWHRHRTQCLGPDTLVHFDAPKSRSNRRFVYKMRIEDVWQKWQPTTRKSRPERQTNALFPRSRIQAMRLRCFDESLAEFGTTRIADVIKGDAKPMVRVVTLSGRSIVATREHRFLTADGWATLGDAISQRLPLLLEGVTRGNVERWDIPEVDESQEEWKAVVGWEGLYEVSNAGRVRRCGCAPRKLATAPTGYSVVSLNRPGVQILATVHRLVLEAFCGPALDGAVARHLNHNRADNRVSNLAWGSLAENSADMRAADRQQRLVGVFEDIASVEEVGDLPTFDLSVDGPWHNFSADGFVVHNSYNEMSARYAPLPDLNYIPTRERLMMGADATSNKQAGAVKGAPVINEVIAERFRYELGERYRQLEQDYQNALGAGVPKELARVILPVGRYSRMRASTCLRNWLAFLTLRMDPGAQWEIRQYANAVGSLIAERFPRTWALFRPEAP